MLGDQVSHRPAARVRWRVIAPSCSVEFLSPPRNSQSFMGLAIIDSARVMPTSATTPTVSVAAHWPHRSTRPERRESLDP